MTDVNDERIARMAGELLRAYRQIVVDYATHVIHAKGYSETEAQIAVEGFLSGSGSYFGEMSMLYEGCTQTEMKLTLLHMRHSIQKVIAHGSTAASEALAMARSMKYPEPTEWELFIGMSGNPFRGFDDGKGGDESKKQ